jgi:hypothetical protein
MGTPIVRSKCCGETPHVTKTSEPTNSGSEHLFDIMPMLDENVPEAGFEPARPFEQWILNPSGLPVPPLGQPEVIVARRPYFDVLDAANP